MTQFVNNVKIITLLLIEEDANTFPERESVSEI